MSFKDQWEKVDFDFFKEFLQLHNQICLGTVEENTFDEFVLKNKEKLNNPDYLQVFSERVEPSNEYFEKHMETCQFFYDFMKTNPDWTRLEFGLRTFIRLGVFEDMFEEFLESKKEMQKEKV